MIYEIFAWITSWVVEMISNLGYAGVTGLMALESACIPIPSEVIMPFSGYLVWAEKFSFLAVVFWGTVGNLLGSLIAYFAGFFGGRPLIEKYGKYLLISREDIDRAQGWFSKYGSWSVFFSRLLPVVRTFISLPAGMARMPLGKFCLYTFLGSLPWSFVLTYVGVIMGEQWPSLETYFRKFDWLIIVVILGVLGWWLSKKFHKNGK